MYLTAQTYLNIVTYISAILLPPLAVSLYISPRKCTSRFTTRKEVPARRSNGGGISPVQPPRAQYLNRKFPCTPENVARNVRESGECKIHSKCTARDGPRKLHI